jgi:hypothetical protein
MFMVRTSSPVVTERTLNGPFSGRSAGMPQADGMKRNVLLTVMSLLSLVLFTLHVTHDIIRGVDRWGPQSLFGVLIMAVWLYGTLVLAERRSGQIIMLLGSLFAAGMPVIHMRGNFGKSTGAFFFIWTLFALGAIGMVSLILSVRALRAGAGGKMTAAAHENPDR